MVYTLEYIRQHYDPYIRQLALRTPDIADEVYSYAYERLWRTLGQFRNDCHMKSWIYRIVEGSRRRVQRYLSASKRQGIKVAEVDMGYEITPLELRDLDRALRTLPKRERKLLLDIATGAYTPTEYAKKEGVPIQTACSRIRRARLRLRKAIQEGVR